MGRTLHAPRRCGSPHETHTAPFRDAARAGLGVHDALLCALICLDKLPKHVAEKYEVWCAIVRASGPQGLRTIKSFHDEKLSGNLAGLRSSRLNQQWRVIYRVEASIVTAFVEKISPHDYRP